jgi:hypothetical protein
LVLLVCSDILLRLLWAKSTIPEATAALQEKKGLAQWPALYFGDKTAIW